MLSIHCLRVLLVGKESNFVWLVVCCIILVSWWLIGYDRREYLFGFRSSDYGVHFWVWYHGTPISIGSYVWLWASHLSFLSMHLKSKMWEMGCLVVGTWKLCVGNMKVIGGCGDGKKGSCWVIGDIKKNKFCPKKHGIFCCDRSF